MFNLYNIPLNNLVVVVVVSNKLYSAISCISGNHSQTDAVSVIQVSPAESL